ncbi:alpha-2-macroglobulin-like [Trichomycterus rosablanca]|uniref:alpha-2-macroglobulin-like n=1 Tax=Trichomycterus rosablanca TaxID=2290929 RepID=UPI002F352D5E
MVVSDVHVRKGLLLAFILFLSANGETLGPYFMVTFPASIESGSDAKFCVSLLKPNETLLMTVDLVHGNQSTNLFRETVETEFHRCSKFKAPLVDADSWQNIRVKVKGQNFEMTEKRKVMFKSYKPVAIIQTDKPIYNPGQTVHFRVVTVDSKLNPLQQEYKEIVLEDNKQNRIGQWNNKSSKSLILQLSHKLNAEASEGFYTLSVNFDNRKAGTHNFRVKKYVLPKFEVTVKAPEEHSVSEDDLKLKVCGKYTFGQPVPGTAMAQICRKYRSQAMSVPCQEETVEMNATGCAFLTLNVTTLSFKNDGALSRQLDVNVTLTEEGTGISMAKSQIIGLTYKIGFVEFIDIPKNFEKGGVIEGKVKVTSFKGEPIPNKEVFVVEHRHIRLSLNLTTDSEGLAKFSFNVPTSSVTAITLVGSVYPDFRLPYDTPYFTRAEKTSYLLEPATPYSPVYSELVIGSSEEPFACGAEVPITIKYYIIGEPVEKYNFDLIYMVLSKGAIVHHGYEKVEVKDPSNVEGSISFKLSVVPELAPAVQVLVYGVLPSENVIAANKLFSVEKCFRNKVLLEFSPSKAVPGEENDLKLSAQPGSLCGVSAVDQSVFILEPGKKLDAEQIFNLLPVKSVSNYPYGVEDELECLHVRPRRNAPMEQAYEALKGVGLKMATNLAMRKPDCLIYKGIQYRHFSVQYMRYASPMGKAYSSQDSTSEPIQTVRNFFPETWIWQLVEVGDSGSAQVPVTVPDTITTWETEAFCLSPTGLGLAPTAQLTVFQPFFLELSLPYSIIRGENFELKATVFNYLPKCIMVKVTPAPSSDYTLKASTDENQYSSCLCANGRKTFKWTLIPSVLGVLNVTVSAEAEQSQTVCDNEIVSVPERGRIDIVTRSLIVQAEGTEKTRSQSWLLCPQGNSVSEELELVLPENVIEGSVRSSVSVLGDILGRALKNLDGLLRMPYGCGEQNIALLSPNIYILQYLENTEQLTTAIREKATGFLKNGYQRQLNYRHFNGAYSTFGTGVENTWLTAFVLRTFGKAQRYIFIDPEVINSAKRWLTKQQRPDGCFITQGRLFNNRMKGGVNDNVTMTAYITASLLELGHSLEDPVVNNALMCLKSATNNGKNTYTTALLAYTFSLAKQNEFLGNMIHELDSVAISGDGRLHWSQSALDDSSALSVEISSYVLLAVLNKAQLTSADLGYANRIVSWLVRQQNPYGGFSSTQDTVVALQALALYATKVFSRDGSSMVTVQAAGGDSHNFEVNQNNKLLYQERSLPVVSTKYSIEAKGSTCVSVQMALFYNIPTPTEKNTLSIQATTEGKCTKLFGQAMAINFNVTYTGPLDKTNMVIVDIKLLSGFTANPGELRNSILVERVDAKGDHIIMYIKEVPKNIKIHYQLHIKQVLPVKNLKPAVMKVYDYYQPDVQSETEYTFSCV